MATKKLPASYKEGWNATKGAGSKLGGVANKALGKAFMVDSALDILPSMKEGRTGDTINNIAWTAQGAASNSKAVGSYAAKKLGARAVPVAGSALMAWEGGKFIGELLNEYTPVQQLIAKGVDKVTGLEARNKRAMAPNKLNGRKK